MQLRAACGGGHREHNNEQSHRQTVETHAHKREQQVQLLLPSLCATHTGRPKKLDEKVAVKKILFTDTHRERQLRLLLAILCVLIIQKFSDFIFL